MTAGGRLAEKIRRMLYPAGVRCLACGDRFTHGEPLCPGCAAQLTEARITGNICPDCGTPLEADETECRRCRLYGTVQARSVWLYQDAAAMLVRRFKKTYDRETQRLLACGLAEKIRELGLDRDVTLTWLTMPERRRKRRGQDHARLLAESAAEMLACPCRQLLVRPNSDHLHTQRGLSGEQRKTNLIGTFACEENVTGRVALIDDVLTTGSTALLASEELLAAGAAEVMVITLTRAMMTENRKDSTI